MIVCNDPRTGAGHLNYHQHRLIFGKKKAMIIDYRGGEIATDCKRLHIKHIELKLIELNRTHLPHRPVSEEGQQSSETIIWRSKELQWSNNVKSNVVQCIKVR